MFIGIAISVIIFSIDHKDDFTHNKLNIDTLIILFVCVCILFSKEIALGSNRVSKCYFLEDYTLRYQKEEALTWFPVRERWNVVCNAR